jgi:uncharacterized protein YhaN
MFMSAIETQDVLSEDTEGVGEGESLKWAKPSLGGLVPVAESIRYRKRAQSAEKKIEALAEQLAEAKSQAAKMAEELNGIRSEQELTRILASSGVVDLEAAVLIAKAKMEGQSETDLDGVIEQLKSEKQYLWATPSPARDGQTHFAGFADGGRAAGAKKTSGARERVQDSRTILERAAKKAATTGNRADLQEYLKLRRSLL